jgi:hypothetical protein
LQQSTMWYVSSRKTSIFLPARMAMLRRQRWR